MIEAASVRSAAAVLVSALLLSVAWAGKDPQAASEREDPIELPTLRVEAVREQIREIGERWRVEPVSAQPWRERAEPARTGRIVWGYDAMHEMQRVEREWLEPDPHPELNRMRPVTVLNVRF